MQPRLHLLTDDQLDPELRTWLDGTDHDFVVRAYGQTPDFAKAFNIFYRPLRFAGRLSPELKELVRLKVADCNGCMY